VVACTNTLGGPINNPAGGVLKIGNGALLNLESGTYPTLGTVTLNSTGNLTDLEIGGANVTRVSDKESQHRIDEKACPPSDSPFSPEGKTRRSNSANASSRFRASSTV
jgi:hypothetical protein